MKTKALPLQANSVASLQGDNLEAVRYAYSRTKAMQMRLKKME